jgi:hypothetical protein
MIDKFLECEGLTIKRNRLQLVGVAAMFTASKVRSCLILQRMSSYTTSNPELLNNTELARDRQEI